MSHVYTFASMKFSRTNRRSRMAEVSMIPLIDLFLNILVFFLVTTTFATTSLFFVDLPDAKNSEGSSERQQLSINISASGEIALNRELVTFDQLRAEVAKIPNDQKEKMPVVLRADQGTRHGQVVGVIDLLRSVGMRNVGIATKTGSSP